MKVSGLDVHRDSIFCAIYDGKLYSDVKEYDSTTNSIRQLGFQLQSEGVQQVAMESTSIYWTPVWDILEEMGFDLVLVNPFLIKQMPGRKSDVKDAQWIAALLHKGLLRGSMVPCPYHQRTSDLYPQIRSVSAEINSNFNRDGQNLGNCKYSHRQLHEQAKQ